MKPFRLLNIEQAKPGDQVKHEGHLVSIVSIERSPDKYHWQVAFSNRPAEVVILPSGGRFTQPPVDLD